MKDIDKPLYVKDWDLWGVNKRHTRRANIIHCQTAQRNYFHSRAILLGLIDPEEDKGPEWIETARLLAKTSTKKARLEMAATDMEASLRYGQSARVLMGLEPHPPKSKGRGK